MSLEAAIQAVGARNSPAASRMGTVTAINAAAASLTVAIAGETPLTGVRWIQSYTPAVDDFVVLLKVGGGWWVLGKNSRDLRAGNVIYDSVIAPATAQWEGSYFPFMSSWSWDNPTNPRVGVEDLGGGHGSGIYEYSTMWRFDFSGLPSGATILSASLDTFVETGPYGGFMDAILRRHTNTTRPTAAPTWVSGSINTTLVGTGPQRFALPSDWIAGLIAGSAAGVGFAPAGYGVVYVTAEINIAYSIPG